LDPNVTPPGAPAPGWSETRFFSAYSPDSGAGLFVHAGRQLTDLGLWWVHLLAWLPGGRVAVERAFGRPSGTDLDFAGLDWRVGETFKTWSCAYDGAAEVTTAAALARGVAGAGVATPIRWALDAEATWPVFDLHPGEQDWANIHNEQLFRCSGSLTVGDETWSLDGVAADDHSSGPRDLSTFEGHHWCLMQFAGRGIHALRIRVAGQVHVMGAIFTAAGTEPVTSFEAPVITDLVGAPETFDAVINGETYRVEALHAMALSATDANDNLIGVPADGPDLISFVECPARFTAPDGTVGHGHLERSARRRDVT
jgi:hypothetical protein